MTVGSIGLKQEFVFSIGGDTLQMLYVMVVVLAIAYVFGKWGSP